MNMRHLVPRPIRRAASAFLARRGSERFRGDLAAMATRGLPVVAGPWLGEVGFELLYWVPFLRRCAERLNVDPQRFVVVSRGGTESWYRPFAARYADVFDQVSAEMFRAQHDVRVRDLGEQKQTRVSDFDQDVVAAAMRHAHVAEWSLLHPSRMYEVLNPYWWGHQSDRWVHDHVRYTSLEAPSRTTVLDLPRPNVAVSFNRINIEVARTWQPALVVAGSADTRVVGIQVGEWRPLTAPGRRTGGPGSTE